MLDIRLFDIAKKGMCAYVLRRYKHTDPKTKRTKYNYKQLGKFPIAKGCPSQLIELLQEEEILQLQNWLADVTFAQQFKTSPDDLAREVLYLPPALLEACQRLYIEAKRADINFIPHQIMLEALLHKAKLIQHKLDKINGFNCGILEAIGIDTTKIIEEAAKAKLADEESRKLFKALLELNQPIGRTCTELETAAKQYGKERRISPYTLKDLADNPNPQKVIKKWYYAVAIDVLHQHGINPIKLVPAEKIATYWAIQQQKHYTLNEAQAVFNKQFAVPTGLQKAAAKAIAYVYQAGKLPS
jgi:hypothetical protein